MSSIDPEALDIRIDTSDERVYFPIKGPEDAELQYNLLTDGSPNVLHVKSTYVPETLRGHGIGSRLAEECLLYADKNDFKVKPGCPFFRHFLDIHPNYGHLRARN